MPTPIAQSIQMLDALPQPIVVVDQQGRISATNERWRTACAGNNFTGSKYLDVCTAAGGPESNDRATVADGLAAVLAGATDKFTFEYQRSGMSGSWLLSIAKFSDDAPHTTSVIISQTELASRLSGQIQGAVFQRIFENAANEVYIGDPQTLKIEWANVRARQNLGYSEEEFRALPPYGMLSAASQQILAELLDKLDDNEPGLIELQTVHIRKDGSEYPAEAQLQLLDLDGRPMLVAQVFDTTQKTRTLLELAQARIYLESAPDATVVASANGDIIASNSQVERLLGYTAEELIGQPVERLVPDRFHDTHVAHRTGFANAPQIRGMGTGLNLFACAKDGREIPIEVSLSPMEYNGQTMVAAALRDMTERVAADQALRASEVRYRELFDNATDLIQSFHADGRIDFVNPAWQQAMGYSDAELPGLRFFDLVAPEDQSYAEQLVSRLREGARIDDVQITYLTKTGQHLHLEGSASWQVVDGERISSRAMLHDVTERKRQEDSLREAKDTAEQATAGKSRFLAAASHDLRQPLQALRLYLSVLTRLSADAKHVEVTDKMGKSLETMSELLDTLLDISRLDSGAITPEPMDLSIRDLLQGIFSNNVQQAEEKGLTLELSDPDAADVMVYSDPGLLARIIDNFVTNAIRYTETGGITLHTEPAADSVIISVTDTGVGIPQDQLDLVFEEYYQLDNDVRDRRKGLGLGLSIVKHIAKLIDTPVEVTSTPAEGSTFSVRVGLSTAPKTTEAASTTNITQSQQARSSTVLFVDDDPAIVDATTMLLETAGVIVTSARSGDEAIRMIDSGARPDLLVSDYRLPGHNGLEVIQHAKARFGADLPVVLMSGDTSLKELAAPDLTHFTLLHKPVDTDVLIRLIENLPG